MSGVLYCGDNLEILDEYIASESVDLIYLDPPFNSQRTFNVVYKDSRAQEEAFKDYWSWEEAAPTYVQYVADAPLKLRSILKCLHEQLIDNDSDLLAYLTMMAPRLAGELLRRDHLEAVRRTWRCEAVRRRPRRDPLLRQDQGGAVH